MAGFEKIGALWLKDGKKGKFMSGTIGGKSVLIFKNSRKQAGDKFPDYEVFKGQERTDLPPKSQEEAQQENDSVPF